MMQKKSSIRTSRTVHLSRFKATEWMMKVEDGKRVPTVTRQMLREMLRKHCDNFCLNVTGWSKDDVEHFLEINHWLYPSKIEHHHVKTVYSLLREMMNVGRIE